MPVRRFHAFAAVAVAVPALLLAGSIGAPLPLATAIGTGPNAAVERPLSGATAPDRPADPRLEGAMATTTAPAALGPARASDLLGPAMAGGETAGVGGPADGAQLARATDVAPFVVLGFTWAGPSDAPARYRVHQAGGWSAWRPLERGDGHQPDQAAGDGETTSDPVWVGWADGWELVTDASATDLQAHLVRPTGPQLQHQLAEALPMPAPGPAGLAGSASVGVPDLGDAAGADDVSLDAPGQAAPAPAGGSDGRPAVLSRATWGARPPSADTWTAQRLHVAIVHHTGSGESSTYSSGDVPAMLRAIQAFHMDARGWQDIGYNFVVDRFGRVWEGRDGGTDKLVVGAQAAGVNTGSFGVAVLGDFSAAAPSRAALDGVVSLVAWKLVRHGADPAHQGRLLVRTDVDRYRAGTLLTLDRVIGHRDVGLTGCPGDLYRYLPELRQAIAARAAQLIGPGTFTSRSVTGPAGAVPLAGDFDDDGRADLLWYRPGTEDQTLWRSRGDGRFDASAVRVALPAAATNATVLDFDGDGAADVLFSGPDAHVLLSGHRGGSPTATALQLPGDALPVPIDFDGDGDDDVLWYSPTTHQATLWTSTGSGPLPRSLGDIGGPFRFAVGDFNGDTRQDVLLYGPGAIGDALWYGTAVADGNFDRRPSAVGGDYQPVVADLNGDQFDDIIWQTPSGTTPLWWGGATFSGSTANVPAGVGLVSGDATGSGHGSLFGTGPGQSVGVWLAGADGLLRSGPSAALSATRAVVGDFTGDGASAVMWWRPGQPAALWLAR